MFSSVVGSTESGAVYREAFAYWEECCDVVRGAGAKISAELAEVGLVLYFSWQVFPRSRKRVRTVQAPIRWTLVRELSEAVLSAPRFARDPFYRFILGMSLCHLAEWAAADLAFTENRRLGLSADILHAPRGYFLHPEGTPWKLQGQLKAGASTAYFDVPDLRHQFVTSSLESWPRGSASIHAYVVFAFAGPRATMAEDLCRERNV